jgi:hypothetical protein
VVTVGKLNITHFILKDIEKDKQTLPSSSSSSPPSQLQETTTTGSMGNNPKLATSELVVLLL